MLYLWNYDSRIGFIKKEKTVILKTSKKRFTISRNQIDWKISDTTNIKECYQSYLKKKKW